MRAGLCAQTKNMDADSTRIWVFATLLIVTLLLKGMCTAFEYALTEVNDSQVKNLAEKEKRYARLHALISMPQKLRITFAMERAIFNVLIATAALLLGKCAWEPKLAEWIGTEGAWGTVWHVAVLLVQMLVTASVLVILTEILPKRLAEKRVESTALLCCGWIRFLIRVLTPFTAITYGVACVVCRLFGVSASAVKDVVTEEEVRMMVDAGNETGTIEESQREMINNIFEFDDVTVAEVMTHRKDLVAADVNAKIGDIVYLAINEGFSRIPVYEQTIDSVIGIIYVKDLLCLVGCDHSEDFTLRQFLRNVMFVPETGKCKDVFQKMTKEKAQSAIVVDEYGGTAGMVTMEDLLEEIVGNIQDEYDDETAEMVQLAENVYTVDGAADPEDIVPKLGGSLPEEHQYDTMSALVVDLLGRIPEQDETPSVVFENLRMTVLLTEDNWISKLKVEKLPEEPAEEDDT